MTPGASGPANAVRAAALYSHSVSRTRAQRMSSRSDGRRSRIPSPALWNYRGVRRFVLDAPQGFVQRIPTASLARPWGYRPWVLGASTVAAEPLAPR